MRNTDELQPKKPVEFSPEYVLWCAQIHLKALKIRHTDAMQVAGVLDDEISRCEQYVAVLETGEKP